MNSNQEVLRETCKADFNSFVIAFIDESFYDQTLHWKLTRFLQFGSSRKMVILPRGFLKTTIASLYVLWRATNNPSLRILYATNSAVNAEKKISKIRDIVERNTLYQTLFYDVIPNFNRVRWSDRCAVLARPENFEEGTFESAGTNTNIISRHYDIVVEDDTVAPRKDDITGQEIMPNKEMIEQAIGWHRLITPLLIDVTTSEIVVLSTRWCSYDLVQHILDNEKYDVFEVPAIKDGKPTYHRYPLEALEQIRNSLGSYLYSALYLNTPIKGEHMIFKPEWIRYVSEPPAANVTISIDPAISKLPGADYTAIVAASHLPNTIIVEEVLRAHYLPSETVANALNLATKYKAHTIYIEAVAFQKSLCYSMRDEMEKRGVYFTIKEAHARSSKEERIRGLQPFFENGSILLRKGLNPEFEHELTSFPYASHDDCIDALSMQLPQFISDPKPAKPPSKNGFRITLDKVLSELKKPVHSYYGA